KFSLLTVTLLCAIAAAAQQPYRARLPAVTERGFYKILIHPEITAYAGMSGDDIRILSPDGGEVPYLKEESRALRRSDLQLFNIISSENGADGRRHIVLRHSGERPLRELIVLLRNTSAVRKIAV